MTVSPPEAVWATDRIWWAPSAHAQTSVPVAMNGNIWWGAWQLRERERYLLIYPGNSGETFAASLHTTLRDISTRQLAPTYHFLYSIYRQGFWFKVGLVLEKVQRLYEDKRLPNTFAAVSKLLSGLSLLSHDYGMLSKYVFTSFIKRRTIYNDENLKYVLDTLWLLSYSQQLYHHQNTHYHHY